MAFSDLNIISNDCATGLTYKHNGCEYCNALPYKRIPSKIFIDMLENYENIDFSKFDERYFWELEEYEINKLELNNIQQKFSANDIIHNLMYGIIDNEYPVIFSHYIFDPTFKTVMDRSFNIDIRYSRIRKYLIDAYYRRVEREKQTREKVFIYSIKDEDCIKYAKEFIDLPLDGKKIINYSCGLKCDENYEEIKEMSQKKNLYFVKGTYENGHPEFVIPEITKIILSSL